MEPLDWPLIADGISHLNGGNPYCPYEAGRSIPRPFSRMRLHDRPPCAPSRPSCRAPPGRGCRRALLWAAAQIIPPRPNVQWAVSVPWFGGPRMGVALELQFEPPWGSSIVLVNTGNEESEDVRIVLGASLPAAPARPSNVDVIGRSMTEFELIPTEEGMIIDLGPMESGERIEVTIYRVTWMNVDDVLEGDEPVERTDRLSLFDPRVRLPGWAALAGLLLLAGLTVQNLAMRRWMAARRPA